MPPPFNVFVNDVTDTLDNDTTARLFADDLKLYTNITTSSTHNLQHQLNVNLPRVKRMAASHIILEMHHTSPWQEQKSIPVPLSKYSNYWICSSDWPRHHHWPQSPVHRPCSGHSFASQNPFSSNYSMFFLSRNISLMTRAFITYVRPTLEYASTIWSPSRITQIIFIEGVQRSFTKRLPGLTNLSYSERIKILKLQSLEHRRLLLDLVQTFKIIHNLFSLKFADFFSYPIIQFYTRAQSPSCCSNI